MSERPSWCPEEQTPVLDLSDVRASMFDAGGRPQLSLWLRAPDDSWHVVARPLTMFRMVVDVANTFILCARCGNRPCSCVGGVPVIDDDWHRDPEDE